MVGKETQPRPVVGTVDITITEVLTCGPKRPTCFFPKFYVVGTVGGQSYRTRVARRGRTAVWNETFIYKCTVLQDSDITIGLYSKGFFGREHFHGQIKDRLFNIGPRNEELTKVITGSRKDNPIKITFRVGETLRVPKCRLFALIIGIEKYKSPEIDDLDGCLNDAKSIKAFFCERLLVPDSHTILLSNEMATRAAIISNFRTHLIENSDIEPGDAIIFYYAGHGSRVDAPAEWISGDNKIETLCPYDELVETPQGDVVCGIPDRTINSLLRELASVKGDNITVIFDSCHSGGIARSSLQEPRLRARFLRNPSPIPATTDSEIWMPGFARTAKAIIPSGFRYEAMSSHVLLAACRQDEFAFEATPSDPDEIPHGAFTNSLLKQLSKMAVDSISYSELIDLLPNLILQNPQCEGKNKNRLLFDGQNVKGNSNTFKLVEKLPGQFEVDAGRIHGVVHGTLFTVQASTGNIFGVLVADEVNADFSILMPRAGDEKLTVPKGARVQVLDWSDEGSTLKVFLHPDSEQQVEHALPLRPVDFSQHKPPVQTQKRNFVRVNSRSLADVDIKLGSNGELHIERLDTRLSSHASRWVCAGENRLDHLPFILDAVAHFNYHLGRLHPLENVTMKLYRLITKGFRVPDTETGNLLVDNEAKLELDEVAEYGFEISNNTELDLFPYLFYFDPADYSIQLWYSPPSFTMDPPLQRLKGRVTVGYGAGGGDPFEFTLKEGEQSDTGFLKLFVSTICVNMDWIAQESPFDGVSRRGLEDETKNRDMGDWGAWNAAITVARPDI